MELGPRSSRLVTAPGTCAPAREPLWAAVSLQSRASPGGAVTTWRVIADSGDWGFGFPAWEQMWSVGSPASSVSPVGPRFPQNFPVFRELGLRSTTGSLQPGRSWDWQQVPKFPDPSSHALSQLPFSESQHHHQLFVLRDAFQTDPIFSLLVLFPRAMQRLTIN